MKESFILALALVLALSSCSPTSTVQTGENASSESSQSESAAEWEDIYAKKIAQNRKKVYEMLENCDDILDTIPNPAKVDTIPTSKMSVPDGETLPDCVADWAYRYFSYMVTGNVYFDRTSQEAQVLRFLAAMRRVDDEIADIIEISAYPTVTEINTDETVMFLNVLFICTPYRYNVDTGEYDHISITNENITVFFSLYKENGEWVTDTNEILYGNYYGYANACKNKTWGRFPEVDRYDVVDYTICEYSEKLYNFGKLPVDF